mmetsp:Transcript_5433/g.12378  ORF Transcript_5433/g.12378 Transcript_5433/m.12378 type:complete len:197 (-) Transcript_5433:444-1034(-)
MHENAANLLEPIALKVLKGRGEMLKNNIIVDSKKFNLHNSIDGKVAAPQNSNLQKYAHPNAKYKNREDISISLIAVASAQRSSSTFLSRLVLAVMPCHLSLGEILIPLRFTARTEQDKVAWEKEGKELQSDVGTIDIDINDLANFILDVGKRRCEEKLQENPQNKCNGHCWVNYKHFSGQMGRDNYSNTSIFGMLF